jgi:hypothetical protein
MIYIDKVISKDHRAHEYNRIVIIGLWKRADCAKACTERREREREREEKNCQKKRRQERRED